VKSLLFWLAIQVLFNIHLMVSGLDSLDMKTCNLLGAGSLHRLAS
jgi:hypothetical protein